MAEIFHRPACVSITFAFATTGSQFPTKATRVSCGIRPASDIRNFLSLVEFDTSGRGSPASRACLFPFSSLVIALNDPLSLLGVAPV